MTPRSAPPHLLPAPTAPAASTAQLCPASSTGLQQHNPRSPSRTLRTERQSALLGKRFPLLLAATSSQTAVSCLEVTGVIESTGAGAAAIHLAHRLRRFPSSPFLHQIVCNAVQQWDSEIQKGDLVLVPAPFPPVRPSSKQANIYIIIYTHTQARTRTHTERTERKGNGWKRRCPHCSSTVSSVPLSSSSPLVLPVSARWGHRITHLCHGGAPPPGPAFSLTWQ